MTPDSRPGVLEIEVLDEFSRPSSARLHVEDLAGRPWQPSPEELDELKLAGDRRALILYEDMKASFNHRTNNIPCCRHLATGRAALRLAPGRHKVYIQHGFEYVPQSQEVEIEPGEVARARFKLARVSNMAQAGWFSGDIHVHIGRRSSQDNPLWIKVLKAEDLQAVNTMSLRYHKQEVAMDQYAYGKEGEWEETGEHKHEHYVISPGVEFRDNNLYGHTTLAGVTDRTDPVSTGPALGGIESYPYFAKIFERVQSQGGISGWAHGGISGPLGGTNNFESVPVEASLGLVDFIEVIGLRQFLGFAQWYALLNCGLRIAAAGGSDFPMGIWLAPWHPTIGADRTYALAGEQYSYRGWLEGIRRGATFATSGPLLQVTVDGRLPGEAVNWTGERHEAVVQARADCVFPMECLEVVINGVVVRRIGAGGGRVIEHEEAFKLDQSSWLAVRTRGAVAPELFAGRGEVWHLSAHTTPVYLLQGAAPVRVPESVSRVIDYLRLMRWNYIRMGTFDTPEHQEEMLAAVDRAIGFYEKILLG